MLTKLKNGLDGTQLKTIALALMVLDHIHYFFEFTGCIPTVFSMLGRLSAPLFLFCTVEGFAHTHDRRRYFIRIWGIGTAMAALEFFMIYAKAFRREAIGYIPWYFNLPDTTKKYEVAWKEIMDEKGFSAPYGLTTAERRHPEFRTRGVGKCEWDGAIWPFASAQTLTAMANFMNNYPQTVLSDSVYFRQMELYVESQYHRGRPYIGEYLDEVTGYWLKGDQERSRYYNHSTFNDLMITGLIGLRPRLDDTIEINPLIPADKWDWFCLDNVLYHGHNLTILWDKNGDRYHCGKGLRIFVNGKEAGHADTLTRLVCENALK